jgi:DNA-binding Xre family transcriptional regulator
MVQVLHLVRTALIEKKMTQAELADAADCHEKTIQNLLSGKSVRQQTLFDVCMVLGLDYDNVRNLWSGGADVVIADNEKPRGPDGGAIGGDVAPIYMGAYSRAAVDHYTGSYLTVRSAFSTPGTIVAYRTDITWDATWPSLLFEERNRPDAPYAHRGRLYVPPSSHFIHLVSLTKGAMRMVVVSQLDQAGQMRGLITTLNKRRAMFVPVSTPIVYAKCDDFSGIVLGELTSANVEFAAYRQLLAETVEQGYASLVDVADLARE